MWKLQVGNISQYFNRREIFKDISFEVHSGHSLILTGPNGSGKTTLIRIMCQLIRPSLGTVTFYRHGNPVDHQQLYGQMGLVGPYLQLYNQLTALENYVFFSRIGGTPIDIRHFKRLMDRLGLKGRELDELQTYSSGMLQRAKYVMALIHHPHFLFLDEPTANLDEDGMGIVYQIMEDQVQNGILVVATNEPEEFKFGEQKISLAS